MKSGAKTKSVKIVDANGHEAERAQRDSKASFQRKSLEIQKSMEKLRDKYGDSHSKGEQSKPKADPPRRAHSRADKAASEEPSRHKRQKTSDVNAKNQPSQKYIAIDENDEAEQFSASRSDSEIYNMRPFDQSLSSLNDSHLKVNLLDIQQGFQKIKTIDQAINKILVTHLSNHLIDVKQKREADVVFQVANYNQKTQFSGKNLVNFVSTYAKLVNQIFKKVNDFQKTLFLNLKSNGILKDSLLDEQSSLSLELQKVIYAL